MIKAAALALGHLTADEFERWIEPVSMTKPGL